MTIRADYEAYKQQSLTVQIIRLCNMMYASFSFWNGAFGAHYISGFEELNPLFLIFCLLIGSVFGLLVLITLGNSVHFLVLPVLATACGFSSAGELWRNVLIVPVAATLIVLVAEAVMRSASLFNTRGR